MRSSAFVATVAVCVLLAACGQTPKSGNVGATGRNGSATELKLPGFVAAYPGAKVQSTSIGAGADRASGTFIFETAATPATVIAWYKKKSAQEGLVRGIDMNLGTTSMFTASADRGKKNLQVIAATSGGGARVQVNWTGK